MQVFLLVLVQFKLSNFVILVSYYFAGKHIVCYYLNRRGRGLNPTSKLHDKAVNARVKVRNLKKRRISEGMY